MTQVMQGVNILEVAEQVFVPSASALLADLGAEVIKIEHVTRGDAVRGIAASGAAEVPPDVHPYLHHCNRGKRSLGLDLSSPQGRDILYKLAAQADVFMTNKLASTRQKLQIEDDDIRAHNPQIIFVRGSGQGERGQDADQGTYDQLAFWSRGGVASGVMRPDYDHVPMTPGPGFGDTIGALAIAGGIMGALFHRERTGKGSTIDVSLLGTALWAEGQAIALSLATGRPYSAPPLDTKKLNPLWQFYRTSDNRWIALNCLQAGRYWEPMCKAIGRPELVVDPRFADHESLLENTIEAEDILKEAFAAFPLNEWRERLEDFDGQWAVVQNLIEAANDRQSVANGYLQQCRTATGMEFQLVSVPMQYDGAPATPRRGPDFNEHGDEILAELGFDWDTIVELKVQGVVA